MVYVDGIGKEGASHPIGIAVYDDDRRVSDGEKACQLFAGLLPCVADVACAVYFVDESLRDAPLGSILLLCGECLRGKALAERMCSLSRAG